MCAWASDSASAQSQEEPVYRWSLGFRVAGIHSKSVLKRGLGFRLRVSGFLRLWLRPLSFAELGHRGCQLVACSWSSRQSLSIVETREKSDSAADAS